MEKLQEITPNKEKGQKRITLEETEAMLKEEGKAIKEAQIFFVLQEKQRKGELTEEEKNLFGLLEQKFNIKNEIDEIEKKIELKKKSLSWDRSSIQAPMIGKEMEITKLEKEKKELEKGLKEIEEKLANLEKRQNEF